MPGRGSVRLGATASTTASNTAQLCCRPVAGRPFMTVPTGNRVARPPEANLSLRFGENNVYPVGQRNII